jgi:hypothetical protein
LPREPTTASRGASGYSWWARRLAPSIGERVGTQLGPHRAVADPFGHGICFIEFLGREYDEIADK